MAVAIRDLRGDRAVELRGGVEIEVTDNHHRRSLLVERIEHHDSRHPLRRPPVGHDRLPVGIRPKDRRWPGLLPGGPSTRSDRYRIISGTTRQTPKYPHPARSATPGTKASCAGSPSLRTAARRGAFAADMGGS